MTDELKKLSGAEEYIAAEIELRKDLDPDRERSLRDALDALGPDVLNSYDIGAREISLCYDPTRTSQEKLLQLIKQAGGLPEHVESEGSPLL